MNGGTVTFHFKGDSSNLDKTTNSITKNVAVGDLLAKGVSKAIGVMTQNIDKAIGRIDTMNNFPKIMEMFGVSTDEANASIKRIDKSVRGLPTSLDQAVAGVQDIFMVTKDLKKAEKMFQAINDSAMVFANGSTQSVNLFIYAYKQAMAQGKMSAGDFNQMNSAIPGLMDKVAESMGITFAELKEGLSKGEISMEQFNSTLQKLDTEGVGSMSALQSAAKTSTGGIQTSISNMRTAIVRGISNMISKVNESLAPFGGLSGVLSSVGKVGEQAFTKLGNILGLVIPKLVNFAKFIKQNKTAVTALVIVLGSLYTAFKVLTIINTIKNAIAGFRLAITLLKTQALLCGTSMSSLTAALGVLNLSFLASPIFWIIAAIIALVAGFVLLWNKCEAFRNFWIGLWEGIKNVISVVGNAIKVAIDFIIGIFTTVIDFIKNNWQGLLLLLVNPFLGGFKLLYDNCEPFRNFVNNFVNAIKNFFTGLKTGIGNAINGIVNFIKSLPGKIASIPGKIISFFSSLPGNMLNIGKNIMKGLWNGIQGLKNWVIDKVKGIGSSILNGLKGILGIHSPSTEFAIIGKFSMLGYEEGLEKMQPEIQRSIDSMFSLSPQMTGSMNNSLSPSINVQNNVSMETDPLGQVVNKIKTFSGGSRNDYNYGVGV